VRTAIQHAVQIRRGGINLFRRAANYVGRILNGEKPADLPVRHSTKFDFAIKLTREGARPPCHRLVLAP
jgi:hypothetical protein